MRERAADVRSGNRQRHTGWPAQWLPQRQEHEPGGRLAHAHVLVVGDDADNAVDGVVPEGQGAADRRASVEIVTCGRLVHNRYLGGVVCIARCEHAACEQTNPESLEIVFRHVVHVHDAVLNRARRISRRGDSLPRVTPRERRQHGQAGGLHTWDRPYAFQRPAPEQLSVAGLGMTARLVGEHGIDRQRQNARPRESNVHPAQVQHRLHEERCRHEQHQRDRHLRTDEHARDASGASRAGRAGVTLSHDRFRLRSYGSPRRPQPGQ